MAFRDWIKSIFSTKDSNAVSGFEGFYGYNGGAYTSLEDFLSGTNAYASDFINNAIAVRANEIAKLDLKSVVEAAGKVTVLRDDISRLFREGPNPWQSTSDFLSCAEWMRCKKGNAYIYPSYDVVQTNIGGIKRYRSFYVLNPTQAVPGLKDGSAYYSLMFSDGYSIVLPATELIHLKWRRGTHFALGGDDYGTMQTDDLKKAVEGINKILDGVPKSIEASLNIKGVHAVKTLADAAVLKKSRADFEEHIIQSKSGIIFTDITGEFKAVDVKVPSIPVDIIDFLRKVISSRYAVSLEMINGNATDEQHEAFYQGAIEEFIVQLEQEFTKKLYTPREKDIGHKVRAYYAKVKKMSFDKITNLATLSTNTAMFSIDEMREWYGYGPQPNGTGQAFKQSLNFINSDDAHKYQVGASSEEDGQDG